MTAKTTHRALVALALPNTVPALITYAMRIVTAMTGNPAFPAPVPQLAAVTAAVTSLQTAEQAALARTKGAVATRNEQRTALVSLLQHLKAYIQVTADANAENATSIIESAGVAVRKEPVRRPRVFAAKPGANSGTVELVTAAAGRRASYEWQFSTDGGKTWVSAPSTLQAKTTVTGLTPGATVEFRYRPVTKTGEGNWSQTVQLIVK
ncbi:MAG TPA: fibronectin type III domain-containing protein [Polyangiaceae bacterium]|nr:fibronectin type III domain-containing protein [Polyangiaceae bacterium]